MALETTTITALPNAQTPLSGTERLAMDQGGTTVDASAQDVAALAGDAIASAIEAHEQAADPHPGYLTPAEGNAAYATAAQGAKADTAIQPGNPALSDAREWTATVIDQPEAEAGTGTTPRKWTAQRVRQNVQAWWDSILLVAGKIPAAYLPSYVDDVIEVTNFAALPPVGEVSKIYVTLNDNKQHRWSGSAYITFESSPGSTDAVAEGVVNLYFTTARAIAAVTGLFATAAQGAKADTAIQPGNAALTDAREWTATLVDQPEAEAGTGTTARKWSALRVRQSVQAWWDNVLLATGKIPAIYLPSYVDDIIEVANFAALPATGENGKIYVTLNDNRQHRWSGSAYITFESSPGSTDAVAEGSVNLYFTTARAIAAGAGQFATAAQGAKADTAIQPGNSALSDAREWIATTVSQSDAEAGTLTTRRAFTPERVRQAIVAWWNGATSTFGRSWVALADAAAGTAALNNFTTTLKGLVPAPGTATGKVLGDSGSWIALGGGGDALVASPLSQFAATSSDQLRGVISDETGTGALVFANSPTLVTPSLGTPSSLALTNATGLPIAGVTGLSASLAGKADLVGGVVPTSQIPSVALVTFLGAVNTQANLLLLRGEPGDWAVRTDRSTTWVIVANNGASLSDWYEMPTGISPVGSVNGQTGSVVLGTGDIGESGGNLYFTTARVLAAIPWASPGAIGGTTPAAGTFSALAATTTLLLPGAAPSTPAAGHIYRIDNSLRYRDSTATERLLLNATDNLANLDSMVTARANLGLKSGALREINVGATAPSTPAVGDMWVDTT
jgi:uncharacterized protein YukE